MIEEKVRNLLETSINSEGYKLDEIKYGKDENNINTLTLVIDKDGYINIADCVKVNDIVNPLLDEADLIEESYVLDVCSKEKGNDQNGQ